VCRCWWNGTKSSFVSLEDGKIATFIHPMGLWSWGLTDGKVVFLRTRMCLPTTNKTGARLVIVRRYRRSSKDIPEIS
jgi:hypothetical protein